MKLGGTDICTKVGGEAINVLDLNIQRGGEGGIPVGGTGTIKNKKISKSQLGLGNPISSSLSKCGKCVMKHKRR